MLTTAFTEKYKWTSLYGMEFPCLISVVGQPSSGKTHFTLNLLNSIKDKFTEIIAYLGTRDSSEQFLKLMSKDKKPIVKILYTYNEADLKSYIDKLEKEQESRLKSKKEPKSVLIVGDDIYSFPRMMRYSRDSPSFFQTLSANYRHLNVSLLICSQKWTQLTPNLRIDSVRYIFITSTSKTDLEKIADEHETLYHSKNRIKDILFEIRSNVTTEPKTKGNILMITNYANMEQDKFKWIKPDGSTTVMKPEK